MILIKGNSRKDITKTNRNIRSLSPEDSRTYVRDVYEIMVELAKKSSNIFYYSIH